jgi:hypothetical membrane protein
MERAGAYAGWIVVDLRLLTAIVLLSVGITLLLIGIFVRKKAWHEYVTIFVALTTTFIAIAFFVCHAILRYPVVLQRHFFQIH